MSHITLPTGNEEFEKHITVLLDFLNVHSIAGREVLLVMLQNLRLFEAKHQDYGCRNVGVFGTHGQVVMLSNKIERVINLMGQKRRKPQNESLEDSFRDISNHAIIGLLCLEKRWPDREPSHLEPKTIPVKRIRKHTEPPEFAKELKREAQKKNENPPQNSTSQH